MPDLHVEQSGEYNIFHLLCSVSCAHAYKYIDSILASRLDTCAAVALICAMHPGRLTQANTLSLSHVPIRTTATTAATNQPSSRNAEKSDPDVYFCAMEDKQYIADDWVDVPAALFTFGVI